jgi:hypothetical protein
VKKLAATALLAALVSVGAASCQPLPQRECYVLPPVSEFKPGTPLDYSGSQHGGIWYVDGYYYGVAVEEDSTITTC